MSFQSKNLLAGLVCLTASTAVWANPDVTSREYHVMLNPSDFSYATEQSNINALASDATTVVEAAINRDVTGTMSLSHNRQVLFFDTPSSCDLKNIGYIYRERVENGDSEVTLKYRGPDRYIADFEDLSTSQSGESTKLEADISTTPSDTFLVSYSHQTTVPNTRTINDMHDIQTYFPGFNSNYDFASNLGLSVVGNLNIIEHEYEGISIDLGQFEGNVSVTLWYKGEPAVNTTPIVAELSFRYKDSSADYTKKVVNRAKLAFDALRSMSWYDPAALGKTSFVYQYEHGFCQ
jgi:hypothetical protein